MQCIRKPGLRGIVIAQIYKTLSRVLVREIQVVCAMLSIHYAYNKSSMEMLFDNGTMLFFYSGENATGVLGLSEIDLLAMDEAAYISGEVYNFSKDRMRGGKYSPVTRLISSPVNDDLENWFRELCEKYPDCVVHASAMDNPFTTEDFKQDLRERYVEGSPLYMQQVEGRMLDTDVSTQIVKRSDFCELDGRVTMSKSREFWMGSDFSGGVGCDSDVNVVIDCMGVTEWVSDNGLNTQQKVAAIKILHDKYNPASFFGDNTGGFGKGALDLCEERNIHMEAVNFEQKAFDENQYPNARTEMYMELAKEIRAGFYVPPEIRPEILAQRMFVDKRGRVALVPKELVKKTLGRSPDAADALALAVYAKNHGVATPGEGYSAKQASEVADRYLAYL